MTAYELRKHLAAMHNLELRGVSWHHMVCEHNWLHERPEPAGHDHPDNGLDYGIEII